jgi:hypothetical protein
VRGLLTAAIALSVCLMWHGTAAAFEILTPVSDPCHERLVLAAFDAIPEPWSSDEDRSLDTVLGEMVAAARAAGVPDDRVTRGFVNEIAQIFGHTRTEDPAEAWVVASLVSGVRGPDTLGFAVLQLNEVREIHINDGGQARHSLRRSDHDHAGGVAAAVADARSYVKGRAEELRSLHQSGEPVTTERWTFAFYDEHDVHVYGPAHRLGELAHTVQDAYTHTIRDDDLQVIEVLNFVEAIAGGHQEQRDGRRHSDRLDRCDVQGDVFDGLRFEAARAATIEAVAAAWAMAVSPSGDSSELDAALDEVYRLRDGCSSQNEYCGSSWAEAAAEEATTSVSLGLCHPSGGSPVALWPWILAMLWLRRRSSTRHPRGKVLDTLLGGL